MTHLSCISPDPPSARVQENSRSAKVWRARSFFPFPCSRCSRDHEETRTPSRFDSPMNYLVTRIMWFRRETSSIFYVESDCEPVKLTERKVNESFPISLFLSGAIGRLIKRRLIARSWTLIFITASRENWRAHYRGEFLPRSSRDPRGWKRDVGDCARRELDLRKSGNSTRIHLRVESGNNKWRVVKGKVKLYRRRDSLNDRHGFTSSPSISTARESDLT